MSWKYLQIDIYHRAQNYLYLKKYKSRFPMYLIISSENYQNLYVYSYVKVLSEIAMPQSKTINNNWKYLQSKFKSHTAIAKWLILKEETLNNDIYYTFSTD